MKSVCVRNVEIGVGIPKICVPVLGNRNEEYLDAARKVKTSCADLAEIRIDWYQEAKDVESVIGLISQIRQILDQMPLLFTFRTANEGGNTEITADDYEALMKKVIESGIVDLIDVELEMGEELFERLVAEAHENGVHVIASNHDFNGTPDKEEMLKRLKQMDLLGADILKIAVFPQNKQDVLTLLATTLEMSEGDTDKPIVTMSMGEEGLISRLSGEVFGSAITFGTVTQSSAPGQISAEVLQSALKLLHVESTRNIFFVGFMGAGKSTIAKQIAKSRKASLIEMDEELEQMAGMPISEIFETFGETYFRDLESKFLSELLERKRCIISCGGGIMLRPENVEMMKKNGYIVYLEATPETIYERVKNSNTRPILNGNMNVEYIRDLMKKRCDTYKEEANITIKTDGKPINQICEEILEKAFDK